MKAAHKTVVHVVEDGSSFSPGRSGSLSSSSPVSSPPASLTTYLEEEELSLSEDFASLAANFELRILTQPPAKTVYQRILKPFPSVVLAPKEASDDDGPALLASFANGAASAQNGAAATATTQHNNNNFPTGPQYAGLFLEASLVRNDTGASVAKCLDGNCMARFERSSWNGGVLTATFKKLKILSTSQQLQGALLRLQFTLKKYTGSTFATVNIPNRSVLSQPIEVFSHSQYLHKKKEKREGKLDVPQRRATDDDEPGLRPGKLRRIEHDSVHFNLIAAIKAFQEQGGTKEVLIRCIEACYSEDDATQSHSSLPTVNNPAWEITLEDPSRHQHHQQQQHHQQSAHLPHSRANSWIASQQQQQQCESNLLPSAGAGPSRPTTTTSASGNYYERSSFANHHQNHHQRRGSREHLEVPADERASQPSLPPLRQELGAVLQATQPPRPLQHMWPVNDVPQPSPAQQPRLHRGSLPEEHVVAAVHQSASSPPPPSRHHRPHSSSFSSPAPSSSRQPSNILPSLSSLLLLPPSAPASAAPRASSAETAIVGDSALPSFFPYQAHAPSHLPSSRDFDAASHKRKRDLLLASSSAFV